ncbi:hypothetical protein HGH92_02885 [Chitinophaga varians]|uniref:Leucine-rich repeat domain-containing protein n=1 Tax=Chitinophaga varians TaxID=2202339 RepID=A0A847RJV1_9BACT|nr:hypothetical protein [Chitinophaga varians]NLR63242.1 hypothetical protein [Chitinophaga varians]
MERKKVRTKPEKNSNQKRIHKNFTGVQNTARMTVDIEINSAKDIDLLKDRHPDDIDRLNLFIYTSISLKFIQKLKNLKGLLISGSVKDLSPISHCKSLKELSISCKGAVNSLDFLPELSLESLKLEGFTSKNRNLVIPDLPSLKNIEIAAVSAINDLTFLADFSAIERISLFDLNVQKLFGFSTLKLLKELRLVNMFHLKDLSELATINSIDRIYIHEFYVNKKIRNDKKAALLKIMPDLKQVGNIELNINNEKFSKEALLQELSK